MNKKFFIILISIILLLILGLGLYLIFGSNKDLSSNKTGNPETLPQGPDLGKVDREPTDLGPGQNNSMIDPTLDPNTNIPAPNLPADKNAIVKVLTENPAIGFAIAGGGKMVYFDKILGKFMQKDLGSNNPGEQISTAQFTGSSAQKALWAPNKQSAILNFGGNDQAFVDLKSGKSTNLHQLVNNISWSADGRKIVYEFKDEENNGKLTIASPDGSNPQVIKELGYTSRILGWSPLAGGPISYVQVYAIGAGRNVYPVYEDGSSGNVIKFDGFGDKAIYSRDGLRILYEVLDTEDFKQTLWVVDYNGLNQYSLGVQTFTDKCVWDAKAISIYCAVPNEELDSEPDLEDDTIDSIWKINTKTGEKTEVFDETSSEIKIDAENLWLSLNEDKIYLENRKDGLIYEISI